MSDAVVIDASVVLAYLLGEPWGQDAEPPVELFRRSLISSVNMSEIISRLVDLDLFRAPHVSAALQLLHEIPFTPQQARIAGELRATTRAAGLSLGDRACIALAIDQHLEVYTADRPWLGIDLPCVIHLIRP